MSNWRLALAGLLGIGWIVVGGCRTFSYPANTDALSKDQSYWIHYDATKRGSFLLPQDYEVKVLSEPSPDVAISSVVTLVGSLQTEGMSAEAKAKIAEEVVKLGKRTESIMFLREALYRLSELGMNAGLDKKEMIEQYGQVIATWSKIADADQQEAKAAAKRAEFEATRARTLETLIRNNAPDKEIQQRMQVLR